MNALGSVRSSAFCSIQSAQLATAWYLCVKRWLCRVASTKQYRQYISLAPLTPQCHGNILSHTLCTFVKMTATEMTTTAHTHTKRNARRKKKNAVRSTVSLILAFAYILKSLSHFGRCHDCEEDDERALTWTDYYYNFSSHSLPVSVLPSLPMRLASPEKTAAAAEAKKVIVFNYIKYDVKVDAAWQTRTDDTERGRKRRRRTEKKNDTTLQLQYGTIIIIIIISLARVANGQSPRQQLRSSSVAHSSILLWRTH